MVITGKCRLIFVSFAEVAAWDEKKVGAAAGLACPQGNTSDFFDELMVISHYGRNVYKWKAAWHRKWRRELRLHRRWWRSRNRDSRTMRTNCVWDDLHTPLHLSLHTHYDKKIGGQKHTISC